MARDEFIWATRVGYEDDLVVLVTESYHYRIDNFRKLAPSFISEFNPDRPWGLTILRHMESAEATLWYANVEEAMSMAEQHCLDHEKDEERD